MKGSEKMKDLRGIALIFVAIGFFIIFGAAGASDCDAPMSQVLTLVAVGVIIIAVSIGYIYLYEKLYCS